MPAAASGAWKAVFEHVKGVSDVVSGYAGGAAGDPTYDKVSTERTGHAEAVRITFDQSKVAYRRAAAISTSASPTTRRR